MATSGTIGNTFRTGYKVQITWNVTGQNVADNTSTVAVNVQLVSLGSSYTINSSATKNGSVKINGTTYNFTFNASLTGNQTKTIHSRTVTVAHNADGTKTCSFSCSAGINVTLSGTYYGNVSASGSGVFNTIARATTPTLSATSINMGSAVTINTPRKSGNFTHTLTYSFGSKSGTIATNVATSYSWTLPLALAEAIPSATSGTGTITCATYNGSTLIGSKSISFTGKVPASVVPKVDTVTITEATSGIAAKFAAYVQNKSTLKVVTASSGAYLSTIQTVKTTVLSKSYTGANITTAILDKSGTVAVVVTVTDSRGRTASKTTNVTVVSYASPTISTLTAFRSDTAGASSYEGTNARIDLKFTIASVNSKNTNSYKLEYKLAAATTWQTLQSGNSYSYNSGFVTGSIFGPDSSFHIRLTITDFFGSVSRTVEIPTAFTLIDYNVSGKGLAFGKVSELAYGVEFGMPVSSSLGHFINSPKHLQANEDLNNVLDVGFYTIPTTAISPTILNKPITGTGTAVVLVYAAGNGLQRQQQFWICDKNSQKMWQRYYYSGGWGSWHEVIGDDTGWITATLTSLFENYSGSATNALKYRRSNGVVYIRGSVTPTGTITGGTATTTITTLPAGYRPTYEHNVLCQGSGASMWLLSVTTGGLVRISRYRTGDAWANIGNNTWLPVSTSFLTE